MQRGRKQKRRIKQVQSGIALSGMTVGQTAPVESFLTSRTARVLLAGAGFLADAVNMVLQYNVFIANTMIT